MKGITFLGDGGWFWIVLGLLFLFPKKTRKAGVTALLALAIGAVVTNLCLKDLVARIRPYDSVEGLVPLVARLKDYSFPSGHTCASFACAGVYYKAFPGKWGKSSHGPGSTDRFVSIVRGSTLSYRCAGWSLVGTFSALAALKLVRYYEERKAK